MSEDLGSLQHLNLMGGGGGTILCLIVMFVHLMPFSCNSVTTGYTKKIRQYLNSPSLGDV